MRMLHVTVLMALATALFMVSPRGYAQESAKSKPDAGETRAVRAQLDALGLAYKIDDDGDFRLTYELANDRTQQVFVITKTHAVGRVKVRELLSPAYKVPTDGSLSAAVANHLLEESNDLVLGAWARHGQYVVLVTKIPADTSLEVLEDAIEATAKSADKMEQELNPKGSDDH